MSQENVETVRKTVEAFNRRDFDAARVSLAFGQLRGNRRAGSRYVSSDGFFCADIVNDDREHRELGDAWLEGERLRDDSDELRDRKSLSGRRSEAAPREILRGRCPKSAADPDRSSGREGLDPRR